MALPPGFRIASLTLSSLTWLAILMPPLFLVAAVQHGAITHPYWDYCEFIPFYEKLQLGTFGWFDLVASHNHTRPATLRALILGNAWLTGWDVRSDYVYLIGALFGAFLVQAALLRRMCQVGSRGRLLALLGLLSLVSFSPAGHHNHWWSMMIQLGLAHLLIVIALALVAVRPRDWAMSLAAALACLLASFTLTNGFVAFAACLVVTQLASETPLRPDRLTLFWAGLIVLSAVAYVPGLQESASLPSPAVWALFSFAYLGAPLVGLLWYPFESMFHHPQTAAVTATNIAAGAGLLLAIVALTIRDASGLRVSAAARATLLFGLVAVGSAVLTGLGRVETGAEPSAAAANASRYTMFGSYALYALLYAATLAWDSRGALLRSRLIAPGAIRLLWSAVVICAIVSYARSWKIYAEAREFDRRLAIAYASPVSPLDHLIYPVASRIPQIKQTLQRFQAGPYRDRWPDDLLAHLAGAERLDEAGTNGIRPGPTGAPTLFAYPSSRYAIDVPAAGAAFRFRFGLMPEVATALPLSDGVEFRIALEEDGAERLLWSARLFPSDRTLEREATLAWPAGRRWRTLVFETLPAGRADADWAYWAGLTITSPE